MLAAAESDQQRLLTVNGKKKSKQLSKLYRTRRKRFRHAVAAFARQLVKDLYASLQAAANSSRPHRSTGSSSWVILDDDRGRYSA
jgi:hypothetical protein